jgi:hypothetical protein
MHTTEPQPGWTADIKQIHHLPSACMRGQSTVGSAEVANGVVKRCAVPQTQDAFGVVWTPHNGQWCSEEMCCTSNQRRLWTPHNRDGVMFSEVDVTVPVPGSHGVKFESESGGGGRGELQCVSHRDGHVSPSLPARRPLSFKLPASEEQNEQSDRSLKLCRA